MKPHHSTRWARPALLLGLLLLAGSPLLAQQYSVRATVLAGGGATSAGGSYRITGTIGQSVAGGPAAGGLYAVMSGFWAIPQAVQTGDGPTLSIVTSSLGITTISWTPAAGGHVLQQSSSIGDNLWTDAPTFTTNPVNIPTGSAAQFYRLRKL